MYQGVRSKKWHIEGTGFSPYPGVSIFAETVFR